MIRLALALPFLSGLAFPVLFKAPEPATNELVRISSEPDWQAQVQQRIAASEYEFAANGMRYEAPNRAQGLRAQVGGDGLTLQSRLDADWSLRLWTTSYGQPGKAEALLGGSLDVSGNRCDIARDGIVEWYVNDERGIEHGWTLTKPVEDEAWIGLAVEGLALKLGDDGLGGMYVGPDGAPRVLMGGLKAWDANGRPLAARFEPSPEGAGVRVDVRGAAFPVTVDPVLTGPAWNAESNQAGAQLGYSVAAAGDVNGDGISDVIVGVPYFDNGQTDEGRIYVYHGSAGGLSTVENTILESNQASAFFGTSVAGLGDINGDAYGDIAVGAPNYDAGQTDEGAVFVYFGSANGITGAGNIGLQVDQTSAFFGSSVAGPGDVDGDGFNDLLVGAPRYDQGQLDEGVAFIFRGTGASGGLNLAWTLLQNINNTTAPGCYFGTSVAGAGDINRDGKMDIVVGAPAYSNGQAGEGAVFVWHGQTFSPNAGPGPNWIYEPNQISAQMGASVAGAGDVNGDGYADIVVGAPQGSDGTPVLANEGLAFVFAGTSTGMSLGGAIWLGQVDQAGANYGAAVGTAGDVNGDGYADIAVGAPQWDNGQIDEGRVCLYLGGQNGPALQPSVSFESDLADARMGNAVAGAGDANNDGFHDLLAGVRNYANGQSAEGRALLYYGQPSPVSAGAIWSNLGQEANGDYGTSISFIGDLNGDGFSDFVVSAYREDVGAYVDAGRVYVYLGGPFGSAPALTGVPLTGRQTGEQMGNCVAGLGDVNRDGYDDFMVGSRLFNGATTDEGIAYVFHGTNTGFNSVPAAILSIGQTGANFGHWVAGAGDVNGDGYADALVGAHRYDGPQGTDSGGAFLYLGGPNGITNTPAWSAAGTLPNLGFGSNVAGAGDVNRDGYADVLVGAYDSTTLGQGAARLYFGGPTGLGAPSWGFAIPQNQAHLSSLAGVGDINGDGFADFALGSPEFDGSGSLVDEGRVYVFHGAATTPSATPALVISGGQAGAQYGFNLAPAGDVNADGLSDLLVTAPFWDASAVDEGRSFIYLGSSSGLIASPYWIGEVGNQNAGFGVSCAGGGDANGDGFGDVLVGALDYNFLFPQSGAAFLYCGNGLVRGGPPLATRHLRTNNAAVGACSGIPEVTYRVRVLASGHADPATNSPRANTPAGRAKVRIACEGKALGAAFTGTGLLYSAPIDLGTTPSNVPRLDGDIQGAPSGLNRWRARVKTNHVAFPHGIWLSSPINAWSELDIKTAPDCDGNNVPDSAELATRDCNANQVVDACEIAGGTAQDCDGDQLLDSCEIAQGARDLYGRNGTAIVCGPDGIPDSCQANPPVADCDNDGIPNICEIQSGAADRYGWNGTTYTCAADGVPDSCQVPAGNWDCDSDGLPNFCEIQQGAADRYGWNGTSYTCAADGIPDSCQVPPAGWDCDTDGIPNYCEIQSGAADRYGFNGQSFTCAADGIPDSCQVPGFPWDCDNDGIPTYCEIQNGAADNYGYNGSSITCQPDGVQDSCQIPSGAWDCDNDGLPNLCEIQGGALDVYGTNGSTVTCLPDGIPDSCQPVADCDADGMPNYCELQPPISHPDCNGNQIQDSCDIASGFSLDCNANAVPDTCDLATGTAADCNLNQRPDSCDIAIGFSQDANGNGIPDSCEAIFAPYCFGNSGLCPCGNLAQVSGTGCPNSFSQAPSNAGAVLGATGLPSANFCTLRLQGSGMPPAATVLYFQGTALQNGGNGSAFGDGLRCAAGTILRLGIVTNVNGASTFPPAGSPSIAVTGAIPATGNVTRYYQGWYRDQSPTFCTANRFNLTNGLSVTWLP